MGASASHHSNEEVHPPKRALHVLRVTPGSPASQTDIEPYFDFVVGVDGNFGPNEKAIEVQNLEKVVESHEGKTLSLVIWSSKSNNLRLVSIIPSRSWSTPSLSSPSLSHSRLPSTLSQHSHSTSIDSIHRYGRQPSLLGLTMRICEPEFALDAVWHILEVLEGSPAESAGLVPYGDWIVGWSGGVLKGENDFLEVVEAHVDKPLRVYVYSYDFDTLREVVLVPNRMWGGEGLLGCGVGFGLLHRIPKVRPDPIYDDGAEEYLEAERLEVPSRTTPDNGAYYYDEKYNDKEAELFVPADDIIYEDSEGHGSDHHFPPTAEYPGYGHDRLPPPHDHIPPPPPEPPADALSAAPTSPSLSPPSSNPHSPSLPPLESTTTDTDADADGYTASDTEATEPSSPIETPTPTPSSPSTSISEALPPVPQPWATQPSSGPRSPVLSSPIAASPSLRQFSGGWGANRFIAPQHQRQQSFSSPNPATHRLSNLNGRGHAHDEGDDEDEDEDGEDGEGGPSGRRTQSNGSVTSVDD